jgi:hypothetical protein
VPPAKLSSIDARRPGSDRESGLRSVVVHEIAYLCHMLQQLLIGLIFIAAILYIGRLIFRSFQASPVCSSGCGKCAVSDLDKTQKTTT